MRKRILEHLIPREEAVELLLNAWDPPEKTEMVELDKAFGRIAAEDVLSRNSLPVHRASAGDGIAVRSADFEDAMPDTRAFMKGKDYAPADTGDDFPDAFDAVVMIEDVTFHDGGGFTLDPGTTVSSTENVRPRGATIREGELILAKDTKIRAVHLAALAAGGIAEVKVYQRPKVAFLPTGSELVPRGVIPKRGENVEANGIMVKTQMENMGAEVRCHDIVRDEIDLLTTALKNALNEADIVVICAGTAKGEEDFTHTVLSRCGRVLQHGISTAPGRPVAFAIAENKPVINIPGPTLGAFYAVEFCVAPLINRLLHQPDNKMELLSVQLENDIETIGFLESMEVILRMQVTVREGVFLGRTIPVSASLATTVRDCNALVRVPIGCRGYRKGDQVEVELLYGRSCVSEQRKEK